MGRGTEYMQRLAYSLGVSPEVLSGGSDVEEYGLLIIALLTEDIGVLRGNDNLKKYVDEYEDYFQSKIEKQK